MIMVKISTKDRKFIVPIPYPLLNMLSGLLTSKRMISYANKAIEKDGKSFKVPQINRKDFKPLLKALLENKGLILVDTKLNDGTKVTVRL
ncbi:hypothetical protein [Neobacillus ginsengisoli]|uniref:Uncharacterized protein n=1 Tax=Neobacillus ginsengisoli TaxID=904295 RepID=A0ABT9XQK4_9BACI|nr:hypothetical protein [Neobacillus ginsengisoli]MDQ0197830.1 hypothetical protein [Neobacillus ginsengisoli]